MSQKVQAVPGEAGVVLPDGWVLDGGDQVTISDQTWTLVLADDETLGRLLDLGFTGNQPDPVPTFRDMQRAVAGSDVGLGSQIDTIDAALGDHIGDTTNVHGIADTALLEIKAGAQSKADAALGAAQAYTNLHAAQTTHVHGIEDTALLGQLGGAQVYEQPNDPGAVKEGSIWVDTDEVVAPPGSSGGTVAYTFRQAAAAATWTITHPLSTRPPVVILLDSAPTVPVVTDVFYLDPNTVVLEFPSPVSGYAYL